MTKTPAQIQLELLQNQIFRKARGDEWVNKRIEQNKAKNFYQGFMEKQADTYLKESKNKNIKREDLIFDLKAQGNVYENQVGYNMLVHLLDNIEKASKDLGFTIPTRPIIGTLPTGKVQAMAMRHYVSKEPMIIFEYELFTFTNLISKSVLLSLPFEQKNGVTKFSSSEENIKKMIVQDQTGVQKFLEVLLAYLIKGQPTLATPYYPNEKIIGLNSQITHLMELFVMGHEYAHILLGHTNCSKQKESGISTEVLTEMIFKWNQEFEADGLSLILILQSFSNKNFYDMPLLYAGVDLFLSCLDIMDRSISIILSGKEEQRMDDSHPPVSERRDYIRYHLTRMLGTEKAEVGISLAKTYVAVLEVYFDLCRPVLLDLHHKRTKLAKTWWK
ncbi:ImmA/IrrE family metallo-endopeptidase [Bacillus wiedmannii]|uniref:ImmA/IrrE family metallo-endopeptidase n=1 Tax=Bacillus wiedmannii TaxID=1890302 RepID=UPI000BFA56E0|nr:ImmA/IrrE family metallo-endopeptidase [Bacillus wiedmannii]PFY96966.1 hypothetical protein COL57_15825 [Bacillus wiedmannii]